MKRLLFRTYRRGIVFATAVGFLLAVLCLAAFFGASEAAGLDTGLRALGTPPPNDEMVKTMSDVFEADGPAIARTQVEGIGILGGAGDAAPYQDAGAIPHTSLPDASLAGGGGQNPAGAYPAREDEVPGIVGGPAGGVPQSPASPGIPAQQAPPAQAVSGGAGSATDAADLPYQIYVSKETYTIAILGLDEGGEYTKVVKLFSTATGKSNAQTRAGTYTITGKERWHRWTDTYFSPYASKHSGGLWFHGPNYSSKNSNSMIASTYNQIGTSASSGCMRTTVAGAMWIYNYCPVGTTVIIANDSLYAADPPEKLKTSQRYDPSDPDAKLPDAASDAAAKAPATVRVTSFELAKDAVTLEAGEETYIGMSSIEPGTASMAGFTYATSDKAVATVDATGKIKAIGEGEAEITVSAGKSDKLNKKVKVSVAGGSAANANANVIGPPKKHSMQ